MQKVVLIPGDGIGIEIAESLQEIFYQAKAPVEWILGEAGEKAFQAGFKNGVSLSTLEDIKKYKVALKGPLATPVGYGEKSANVFLRKAFSTYASIRPCNQLPNVDTPFKDKNINLVVVRENLEDLYAGIEYMQTANTAETLKLMSRQGCERIVRLAFEIAIKDGRKSIHCATKANIMKLSEGLMKQIFEEVSKDYPQINAKHIIIDNCAHQLVRNPEQFEVIVSSNMNGDILSDLTAGLVGGLGLAPSANLGDEVAIFESVHGSAPDIAGKKIANPTAFLLSGILMLKYIGEKDSAIKIENALQNVYFKEESLTKDLRNNGVDNIVFTEAVISELEKPLLNKKFSSNNFYNFTSQPITLTKKEVLQTKALDIFIECTEEINTLSEALSSLAEKSQFILESISSYGVKVYPNEKYIPHQTDNHLACRFIKENKKDISQEEILNLLSLLSQKYYWMHVEKVQV